MSKRLSFLGMLAVALLATGCATYPDYPYSAGRVYDPYYGGGYYGSSNPYYEHYDGPGYSGYYYGPGYRNYYGHPSTYYYNPYYYSPWPYYDGGGGHDHDDDRDHDHRPPGNSRPDNGKPGFWSDLRNRADDSVRSRPDKERRAPAVGRVTRPDSDSGPRRSSSPRSWVPQPSGSGSRAAPRPSNAPAVRTQAPKPSQQQPQQQRREDSRSTWGRLREHVKP